MIIGCFTPLVKIFLPEFYVLEKDAKGQFVLDKDGKPKETKVTNVEVLKNPSRITQEETIRFLVPRSVGAFSVITGRPSNVTDLNLAMFLTGDDIGQQINDSVHNETDCYGMAAIPIQADVQGALVASLATGGDDADAIMKAEKKRAIEAHVKAKEISHHRAVRAAKWLVNGVKEQRQKDKEANRGHFIPSPAEYLSIYYLAEQEKQEAEEMSAVMNQFAGMMDKIEAKGIQLGK